MRTLLALTSLCCSLLGAAEYKAGVARLDITPEGPIWLSGYASRTKPSEGVLQRIYAKALAIEDKKGARTVIVTTDLIGLPRAITDVVGARAAKEHGIERARLLLNSSHTHTGPVVRPNLSLMYDLDAANDAAVREYAQRLTAQLVAVIAAALADLQPALLSYGEGRAGFAANRRGFTAQGVRIGVNPQGVTDHSVPVLRVAGPDGRARAVLFGYACHNTTLTGEHYQISGDYAGAAQAAIEAAEPGVTALFMELCAGDQNPNPRSEVRYVEQHGGALAAEVRRVLATKLEAIRGNIKAALQWTELALQPHQRSDFEAMRNDKDVFKRRLAAMVLKQYDERRPVRTVAYPVQAIAFGKSLAIVALGGEPVVEYALRTKAAYPKQRLFVAGYSNDVAFYVPTAKMLEEGGYEPFGSMVYYGVPAPFTPEVETSVMTAIRTVLRRAGIR